MFREINRSKSRLRLSLLRKLNLILWTQINQMLRCLLFLNKNLLELKLTLTMQRSRSSCNCTCPAFMISCLRKWLINLMCPRRSIKGFKISCLIPCVRYTKNHPSDNTCRRLSFSTKRAEYTQSFRSCSFNSTTYLEPDCLNSHSSLTE